MTREETGTAPAGTRVPRTVYVALLTAVFLGGLDLTVLNTALPALDADLRPSASGVLWIVDGYALALAAFLVTGARVGDRHGRRSTLVAGLLVFGAASLTAGLAPVDGVLIGARIVQGIGDALIVSSVVGSIGAIYTGPQRVVAYGLWTGSFSLGMSLGPVLGGALVRFADWRWVFFLNLPLVVLAVLAALRWLPQTRTPAAPRWDPASIGLSVVGLGGIVYALQHLVEPDASVPVVGVVGIVAMTGFLLRQRGLARRGAVEPLVDLSLFANRRFSTAFAVIMVAAGVNSALLLLVSLHLQDVEGVDALGAGFTLLPFAVAIAVGGLLAPPTLRALSRATVVVLALLLQAAGLAAVAGTTGGWRIGALVVAGIAFGLLATLAADLLMSEASADRVGQAGAVQETAFALGSGFGVALLGTIAGIVGENGFATALLTGTGLVVVTAAILALSRVGTTRPDFRAARGAPAPEAPPHPAP